MAARNSLGLLINGTGRATRIPGVHTEQDRRGGLQEEVWRRHVWHGARHHGGRHQRRGSLCHLPVSGPDDQRGLIQLTNLGGSHIDPIHNFLLSFILSSLCSFLSFYVFSYFRYFCFFLRAVYLLNSVFLADFHCFSFFPNIASEVTCNSLFILLIIITVIKQSN